MKYILAFALGLMSAAASAKTVTYTFSGVFDAPSRNAIGDATSAEPVFLGLIKEGDRFSGQFTYDTNAPLQTSFEAGWGTGRAYQLQSFQLQGSSAFNDAFKAWPGSTLNTQHAPWADDYSVVGSNSVFNGANHALVAVLGGGAGTNAFSSAQLPDSFGSGGIGALSVTLYHYDARVYDTVGATAQIQLAAVSPVPEPSSAAMMLAAMAGIGGVAVLRRRR